MEPHNDYYLCRRDGGRRKCRTMTPSNEHRGCGATKLRAGRLLRCRSVMLVQCQGFHFTGYEEAPLSSATEEPPSNFRLFGAETLEECCMSPGKTGTCIAPKQLDDASLAADMSERRRIREHQSFLPNKGFDRLLACMHPALKSMHGSLANLLFAEGLAGSTGTCTTRSNSTTHLWERR